MNSEALFRRYYRQIRSLLPCSRKEKRRILNEIKTNIAAYREQHPEAEPNAVLTHFGTPLTIAAAYIDQMDTAALLKGLQLRRKILSIVLILAAVILVTWLGTVTWAIINEIYSSNGRIVIVH